MRPVIVKYFDEKSVAKKNIARRIEKHRSKHPIALTSFARLTLIDIALVGEIYITRRETAPELCKDDEEAPPLGAVILLRGTWAITENVFSRQVTSADEVPMLSCATSFRRSGASRLQYQGRFNLPGTLIRRDTRVFEGANFSRRANSFGAIRHFVNSRV